MNKLFYSLLILLVAHSFNTLESKSQRTRKQEPPVVYPKGYFEQCQLLANIFHIIPQSPLSYEQLRIDDNAWIHVDYETSLGKYTSPGFNNYKKSKRAEQYTFTYNLFQYLYTKNHPAHLFPSPHLLIPPIIHQIWLGGTPPPAFVGLQKTIMDYHPGWFYKLWTDEDVKELKLINRKYFNKAQNYGEKSDILRYELLYIFGGWYFDWDIESCRSLEPLGQRYEFCVGTPGIGENVFACNAVMGSRPHHPILKHVTETIRNYHRTSKGVCYRTGPIHLTRGLDKQALKHSHRVVVLPTQFLYPPLPHSAFRLSKRQTSHVSAREIKGLIKPETFTVHYCAASWVDE